jgi:hypothetical protein
MEDGAVGAGVTSPESGVEEVVGVAEAERGFVWVGISCMVYDRQLLNSIVNRIVKLHKVLKRFKIHSPVLLP